MKSLNHRIFSNGLASGLSKVLILLRQAALVPLFLQSWGVVGYGEWLLLSSVPTVLAMSNLGLGTAGCTQIALALGANKITGANRILVTSLMVTTVLSIALLLLFGVASLAGAAWLHMESLTSIEDPVPIIWFLCGQLCFNMMTGPLEGCWIGYSRAALGVNLLNAKSLVELITAVIALLLKLTPLEFAAISFYSTALTTILYGYLTVSLLSGTSLSPFLFDKVLINDLVIKGLGFQLSAVWQAILFQGSLWLAGGLLGPGGAATWGTMRTVSRSINQLFSMLYSAFSPELTMAVGANDLATARRLHAIAFGVVVVVAIPAVLALILIGPAIFRLWTGGLLVAPRLAWLGLGVGILFNALWWTSSMVQRAFNHPWYVNGVALVASCISFGVMALLGKVWLINGFVIGSCVFEAVMALYILRNSLKLLDDDLGLFTAKIWWGLALKRRLNDYVYKKFIVIFS